MAEQPRDIGAALREARMRARIDIGEVEMRTKIRAKYLRAIENEEWDLLPGPVYVKSFLRTYAEYLGLDARLLLDEYRRRYELTEAPARPLTAVRRERERERERMMRAPRRPALPSWAIIGVVLVAAVVALYLIGRGGPTAPTPRTTADLTPTTHTTATPHSTTTAKRAHPATDTTPTKLASAPTQATLKLVATGSVWVCVENAAGKLIVPGQTYAPGHPIPAASGSTLLVTLGNDEVDATVDHKPYPLPDASAIGLKITPHGASALPAGTGPTCGQ